MGINVINVFLYSFLFLSRFLFFFYVFYFAKVFYFVLIFLSNTCRPARQHSNSCLCIRLQLQAQKLLML